MWRVALLVSYRPTITIPKPTAVGFIAASAGPVAEQVLLLENIATSLKTGPDQLPTIHNLLLEAVSSPGWQACRLVSSNFQSYYPRSSSTHRTQGLRDQPYS
eukprot:GHUV01035441.1.p2 GENE.GHUV01035441.1~~GHUV01035441.1.p2  ORF type:complete len:102 (-),score=8.28 GHUV01035441.1:467-772(-)